MTYDKLSPKDDNYVDPKDSGKEGSDPVGTGNASVTKEDLEKPVVDGQDDQSHKGEKGETEGEAKFSAEAQAEEYEQNKEAAEDETYPAEPDANPDPAPVPVAVPSRVMEVQIEGEAAKKKVQVFDEDVSGGTSPVTKGIRFTVEVPVTEPDTGHQAGQTNIVSQIEQAIGTVGLTHHFNDFNFSWEAYDGWEPVKDRGSDAKHDPEGDKVGG